MIFGSLLLGIALLLLLAVLVTAIGNLFVRVPFVPVSCRVAEEMVRFANLKGDETVYDLGAGDGRILIAAKRLHPNVRAVGWEFVPTVWLLGKLRIWWSGRQVNFHLGNALQQPVRDTDCIFLYLFPDAMSLLEEKFDRELKPGTKVISYVFPFPHKKPLAQKSVPWLGETKMLRLYAW
ncbi:MAG: class I SAM-dependent methyltransferase [Candidatus Peregrinibacteria bacterium]